MICIKLDFANKVKRFKREVDLERIELENALFWEAATRVVTPSTIREPAIGNHIIINNYAYVRTIILGVPTAHQNGYPEGLKDSLQTKLMGLSTDRGVIEMCMGLFPMSGLDATKLIQRSLFVNAAALQKNVEQNPEGVKEMRHVIEKRQSEKFYETISSNEHKMLTSTNVIILYAYSLKGLNHLQTKVTMILEHEGVLYDYPDGSHEQVWRAALPFNTKQSYMNVQILSPYAAVLASPRTRGSNTHQEGLWFGKHRVTKKDILINPRKLPAFHLMGLGPTGSGKTVAALLLMTRAYSQLGYRVIYTTSKPDEQTNVPAVVEYFNGSIIDIGRGKSSINPLRIFFDKEAIEYQAKRNRDPGYIRNEYFNIYNIHKTLLYKFFAVFYDDLSKTAMSYIDYSLNKVYKKFGIYQNRPETWEGADWPVMSDLIKIWKEDLKEAEGPTKLTIEALLNKSHFFEKDGALSYLNDKADIDTSSDFILVDLSSVDDILQDAMYVLVTGIMSLRYRNVTDRDTIICLDEARVFLNNRDLNEWTISTLTKARTRRIGLWLLTQQPADLQKANVSEEWKTNSFFEFALGKNLRQNNIKAVIDFFGFGRDEEAFLLSSLVGDGILRVDNENIPIHFEATQWELDMIAGKFLESSKLEEDGLTFYMDAPLLKLGIDNNYFMSDWSDDVNLDRQLVKEGFTRQQVQKMFGTGKGTAYIKEGVLQDGKILNQTLDHYSTVIQLAGILIQRGAQDVTVNHFEDVDISFKDIDGKSIAIEYERPDNHTEQQLLEKKNFGKNNYDTVMFVCSSVYYKRLSGILGEQYVVQRGSQLESFIDELRLDHD